MTQSHAQELSSQYLETAKTLCVTSDGAIYIDNDIAYMRNHAKTNGLEIFVFKGEKEIKAKSSDENTEALEKDKSKKTK